MTQEYLEEISLIDTHVHRVHPARSPEWGNLGGGYVEGPGQKEHSRQTLLYHMIMEELRKWFQMGEDVPLEEIERERFRRYQQDPRGYLRELVKDQNVAMYCLEVGSPLGGVPYTQEEITYFDASIPVEKQSRIVRIERAMDAVMQEASPFDEMRTQFQTYFRNQIREEEAIAIKSCAAYEGGLDIWIVEKEDARKAYEAVIAGRGTGTDRKILNNYMLMESVDIAVDYEIPIQIHTGFGGGSCIDFRHMDPLALVDFLRHKKVMNRVKVVLLHGGHPYEEQAGYLTSQFAHVYTDFSGMFYLSTLKGVERMAALLERAPLDKVMYGSDAVMFPEYHWFACNHIRKQLPVLLNSMTEQGYMTERRAREAAELFLHRNALSCYTKLHDKLHLK